MALEGTIPEQRSRKTARVTSQARYRKRKKLKETEAIRDRLTEAIETVQWDWTLTIVRHLSESLMRFSDLELKSGASPEALRVALLRMREKGLVTATRYNEFPPRVEYELTERGRGLIPVVTVLEEWVEDPEESP
jgi:DNA-binding HxlR family transcriptional regulator